MRGLDNTDASDAVGRDDADDKYYLKRIREIIESFPNKGPPATPTRLAPHVYIGSQKNADDLAMLQRLGISHVVNCAASRRLDLSRSSPYPRSAAIQGYLAIPADDYEDFNIRRYFPEAIAFLDEVKACQGRALVHCNLGVNRSGAICAAYLMVEAHMNLIEVMQFLKTKRSVVLYNKGFRRQLLRFARLRGFVDDVIHTEQRSSPSVTSSQLKTSGSKLSIPESLPDSSAASSAKSVSASSAQPSRSASTQSVESLGDSNGARKKFGTKLFRRYGRSLSNNDVDRVAREMKAKTELSEKTAAEVNADKKSTPGEPSRFARSFLTLPRRAGQPSDTNTGGKERLMHTVPEHSPVDEFAPASYKSSSEKTSKTDEAGRAEDRYREDHAEAILACRRSAGALHREAEELEVLSTSRPLRIYRRSATDSEVYRSRRKTAVARSLDGARSLDDEARSDTTPQRTAFR